MKIIPLTKIAEDELDELDPAQFRPVKSPKPVNTEEESSEDFTAEDLALVYCIVVTSKNMHVPNDGEHVPLQYLVDCRKVNDDDIVFIDNALTPEFKQWIRQTVARYWASYPQFAINGILQKDIKCYTAWIPKSEINDRGSVNGTLMKTDDEEMAKTAWENIKKYGTVEPVIGRFKVI